MGVVSPYIVALVVAWFSAHVIKYIISVLNKEEQTSFKTHLFISGGMPSAHAATTFAVLSVISLRDGIGSGLFGLAFLITLIVVYDAVKVRRSSGEQGLAIRALIREQKSDVVLPRAAQGHTPIEVFAGAVLGSTVGLVVFLATT